jgi:hypothetical protein
MDSVRRDTISDLMKIRTYFYKLSLQTSNLIDRIENEDFKRVYEEINPNSCYGDPLERPWTYSASSGQPIIELDSVPDVDINVCEKNLNKICMHYFGYRY